MDVKRYRKDKLIFITKTALQHQKQISQTRLTLLVYHLTKDLSDPFYNFITTNQQIISLELERAIKGLKRDLIEKKIYLPRYKQKIILETLPKYLRKTTAQLQSQIQERKPIKEKRIYTLGLEEKDIDQVIDILVERSVELVIDTRKTAYASKYGFDKHILRIFLTRFNIDYLHFKSVSSSKSEAYKKTLENCQNKIICIIDYSNEFKDSVRYILALNLKRDLKLRIENL